MVERFQALDQGAAVIDLKVIVVITKSRVRKSVLARYRPLDGSGLTTRSPAGCNCNSFDLPCYEGT